MRTLEEWRGDFSKFSELYAEFKNSEMSMGVFTERVGEIFKDNPNIACYRSMIAYRSGLKKSNATTHFIRETIRHEGMHVRIARKIIQSMGIGERLEVVYILEPLLFRGIFGDATGHIPAVVFPNLFTIIGRSRRKYIEFIDKMLNEYPNPSEADRLMVC